MKKGLIMGPMELFAFAAFFILFAYVTFSLIASVQEHEKAYIEKCDRMFGEGNWNSTLDYCGMSCAYKCVNKTEG